MTRPGIEPRSPGPLANTLTIMPIASNNTSNLHTFVCYQLFLFHTDDFQTVCSLFYGISTFSGYLMPNPSFF